MWLLLENGAEASQELANAAGETPLQVAERLLGSLEPSSKSREELENIIKLLNGDESGAP